MINYLDGFLIALGLANILACAVFWKRQTNEGKKKECPDCRSRRFDAHFKMRGLLNEKMISDAAEKFREIIERHKVIRPEVKPRLGGAVLYFSHGEVGEKVLFKRVGIIINIHENNKVDLHLFDNPCIPIVYGVPYGFFASGGSRVCWVWPEE